MSFAGTVIVRAAFLPVVLWGGAACPADSGAPIPEWIRKLGEAPPGSKVEGARRAGDLLRAPGGARIETAAGWKEERARLARKWEAFLGRLPACELAPEIVERVELQDGIARTLLTLQVEPGIRMRCYLFVPPGEGPFPACVCLHSTTDETIRQPAGLGSQPEKAFALDLARRNYVTIAPENFLWCYPGEGGAGGSRYLRAAETFLARHPGVKGMAKMIHDASRSVDYLLTLPAVRRDAIGAIGHSLGAKEVTYLMAFDRRIACGVSSEGGVAFEFTNYHDPWYLGPAVREAGCDCRAEEVVALIAPRPWLLIGGGSADGEKSRPYVDAALPVYRLLGARDACGLFVHAEGHAVPPEARAIAFRWLDYHLSRAGR